MSPTHDMIIDNSTGANVRADINNALAALVSNSSSSSEPATKYAYMWWADTTTGILKIRNSANNAWVELLQLDGTLTLEDGSASTPALAFRDDLNTGIFSSGADKINFATGGVERLELGAETVFNEDGLNVDFRIEGDSDLNNFYLDAGNNAIGIGTSTPLTPDGSNADNPNNGKVFTIYGGSPAINLIHNTSGSSAASSDYAAINFGRTGSTTNPYRATIGYKQSDDILRINANNIIAFDFGTIGTDEKARFDSSGRFLLGTTSARSSGGSVNAHLQLEGTTSQGAEFLITRNTADSFAPTLGLVKTRGTSVGSNTSVADNDKLGQIQFRGADGSDIFSVGASIFARVNGTPSDGTDMPAELVFATTADGASSPTERMFINSSGNVLIGATSSAAGQLIVKDTTNAGNQVWIIGRANNDTGSVSFRNNADDAYVARIQADATNGLQLQVGGSERMRIDTSGNVSIGSTTNGGANRLNLVNNESGDFVDGSDAGLRITNENGSNDTRQASIAFTVSTTGVGSDGAFVCTSESPGNSNFRFFLDSGNGMTEKMRIHSSGELSLATTSKNLQGGGASDFYFSIQANTGSNHNGMCIGGVASGHGAFTSRPSGDHQYFAGFFLNNSAGGVGSISVGTTSTTYNTSSDYRLKENAVSISDGITRLKELLPKRFNWISDDTNTLQDGFFAHEVSSIVPEAVIGEKDAVATEDGGQYAKGEPIYQQIDHSKLVPLLVAAVQELIGKVETLEAG